MSQASYNPTTPSSMATDREREGSAVMRPVWTRTAWGAVIAGALTAISAQLLFTVLGIAVGVSVAESGPRDPRSSAETISLAAGAWWLVSGTLAILLGGMVVGFLSGFPRGMDLHLHALTMWAATAVFGFAVLWSGAGIVSQTGMQAASVAARTGLAQEAGQAAAERARTMTDEELAAIREDARRAARTASWWSVGGLILGIAAALGGAYMAAPDRVRARIATSPYPG